MVFGSGDIVQTIAHNCEIVWLQLNPRASHLLFCDKKGRLHIFDIDNQVCAAQNYSYTNLNMNSDGK